MTADVAAVTTLMETLRHTGTVTAPTPATTVMPPRTTKELPADMRAVLKAFNDAKELIKFACEQKDLLDEQIREALGDAIVGTIDGAVVVQVNEGHNTHVDTKLLRDGWPEAFEQTRKRTDYTYLSAKV